MRCRLGVSLALSLVGLAVAVPARAQTTPDTGACLDANELAVTQRDAHKLRAAGAQLQICAAKACPAAVRAECSRRLGLLSAAIPTVVFDVTDASGQKLQGAKLTMDDEVVAEHLDETPVALDPDTHRLTFEVPGYSPQTLTVTLREGEKARRETVVLSQLPPTPAPGPAPATTAGRPQGAGAPPASEPPAGAPSPQTSGGGLGTGKVIGIVLAGTGVVAALVGSGFGLGATSSWNSAKSECNAVSCAEYAQASSNRSTAITDGTLSDVAFITGGVLVAAGAVLFFASPSPQPSGPQSGMVLHVSPSVGPRGAGLALKAEF